MEAAGSGLEAAIRANLSKIIAQVDELQTRQVALLSTVDGVLDPAASLRLEGVKTTMAKVSEYSLVCQRIKQSMVACDERIAALNARSGRLRAKVPVSVPFIEMAASPEGFPYRVRYRGGISIRTAPSLQSPSTGEVLRFGAVLRASERRSPLSSNGDVFVSLLPEGRGWVIESFAADRKVPSDDGSNNNKSGAAGKSQTPPVVERAVLERISELAFAQALERAAAKAEAVRKRRCADEAAAATAVAAALVSSPETVLGTCVTEEPTFTPNQEEPASLLSSDFEEDEV
jgi:hypothetical protein